MEGSCDIIDEEHERRLLARQAAYSLYAIFQELAPSEALTRALVAERTEAGLDAEFWLTVYHQCKVMMSAGPELTSA